MWLTYGTTRRTLAFENGVLNADLSYGLFCLDSRNCTAKQWTLKSLLITQHLWLAVALSPLQTEPHAIYFFLPPILLLLLQGHTLLTCVQLNLADKVITITEQFKT